ncbi:MAG: DNA-binding protein [Hyphomicrobiales bacterium]|nr:DNA-binding protein [Hyphomicrobiales bacterium]
MIERDTLLPRDLTATSLTAAGFPITVSTLATKATRGGGPPYRLFGKKPLYRWGDALDWAQGRLSKPVRSTSEARSEAAA